MRDCERVHGGGQIQSVSKRSQNVYFHFIHFTVVVIVYHCFLAKHLLHSVLVTEAITYTFFD